MGHSHTSAYLSPSLSLSLSLPLSLSLSLCRSPTPSLSVSHSTSPSHTLSLSLPLTLSLSLSLTLAISVSMHLPCTSTRHLFLRRLHSSRRNHAPCPAAHSGIGSTSHVGRDKPIGPFSCTFQREPSRGGNMPASHRQIPMQYLLEGAYPCGCTDRTRSMRRISISISHV